MDLEDIRHQIDAIDSDIVNLLSKRAALVSTAGKLKKDENGVRDPRRVGQVIEKVRAKALSAGLSPDIAERVYRIIIDCFVNKELLEFDQRNDKGGLT
jgi:isochorismate pyruvate lyase